MQILGEYMFPLSRFFFPLWGFYILTDLLIFFIPDLSSFLKFSAQTNWLIAVFLLEEFGFFNVVQV